MSDGWVELMEAEKVAVPHDRWEQAIGFAVARAEHRGRKQRMWRRDVNDRTYWAICDRIAAARGGS